MKLENTRLNYEKKQLIKDLMVEVIENTNIE